MWITWGCRASAFKVLLLVYTPEPSVGGSKEVLSRIVFDTEAVRLDDGEFYKAPIGLLDLPQSGGFYQVVFNDEEETTGYPEGNPKDAIGRTKPPLHVLPPVALFHMAQAMTDGEQKYGLMNWRKFPVNASVYYDAAQRHLMAWFDGENRAADSGVHHLAHAMACLSIILDAESIGKLNDDRPIPGNLPAFLTANTKKDAA